MRPKLKDAIEIEILGGSGPIHEKRWGADTGVI